VKLIVKAPRIAIKLYLTKKSWMKIIQFHQLITNTNCENKKKLKIFLKLRSMAKLKTFSQTIKSTKNFIRLKQTSKIEAVGQTVKYPSGYHNEL
jgi:hypothetical protein